MQNGCVDIKGKSVKFTWEYRIRMAVEVLRPLAELHSVQEFCHRDVKPSNILLDGNLHAKLADFAGVRNLPEEPGTCTGTGTGNQSVYSTETYADPVYMREVQIRVHPLLHPPLPLHVSPTTTEPSTSSCGHYFRLLLPVPSKFT